MEEVLQKITAILVDKQGLAPSEVKPGAHFIKDLGIDSLDFTELFMDIEQAFNIHTCDLETSQIKTVGQAVEYVARKLGKSPESPC
jgi:acyl carrier protein